MVQRRLYLLLSNTLLKVERVRLDNSKIVLSMISVVRAIQLVGVTFQRQHKRYLYGHPLEVKMMFRNLPVTSVTYVFVYKFIATLCRQLCICVYIKGSKKHHYSGE
jgi:hypothetical protein